MAGRRWLLLMVGLTPLGILPGAWGIPLAQAKNAFFIVGSLMAVIWLVKNWWLRAFLAWAVAAFAWSGGQVWAMAGLLGVLAWTLCYREASLLGETEWPKLRWTVAATVGLQLFWLGLQAVNRDPVFIALPTQSGEPAPHIPLSGWFGNPMDLSLYLGLALPILAMLCPGHRTVSWTLMGLTGVALVALQATAGMVALALTALWMFRTRLWVALPAVVAFLLLHVSYLDLQGLGTRPLIWRQMARLAFLHPVIGWGPNAVEYRLLIDTPQSNLRWNFLFNEYLQGTIEFGVVGLALALGYLASRLWRLRGRMHQAQELAPALMILAAVSVFSIPFRIGPVALLAACYLGQLDRRLA